MNTTDCTTKHDLFPNEIRVIAFDIDGTLAETDDYLVEKIFQITSPVFGWLPAQSVRKIIRSIVMAGETITSFLYFLADQIHIDFIFSHIHNKISESGEEYRYALIKDAVPALLKLSEKYRLAIITAGGAKSTEAFLEKIGSENLFEVVVTAQTCRHTKPSGMPLKYLAEKMNVRPENCLLVGDTVTDLYTARNANAAFIAVRSGMDSEWLLRLFGAKTILNSVADLPGILF